VTGRGRETPGLPLSDRAALVTGAARGIGRVVALELASQGASVALAGRSTAQLHEVADEVRSSGGTAVIVTADVTDVDDTQRMARAVHEAFGRVDVLVANSGVGGPTAPLWEVDPSDWDHTHAVNVRGVFLTCRAVLPEMVRRGSGSVVVMGSMSGKRPLPNRTAYTSSKTALVGLVRSMAWDAGPHGIRVNLVSPGPVGGPRLQAVLEAAAAASGTAIDQLRAEQVANSPLGRVVDAGQVADAVVYLAGDRSAGVTGEDLNVSAGITMY